MFKLPFFLLLVVFLFGFTQTAFSQTNYKYTVYVDPNHPNSANRGEGFANAPFKSLKVAIRWAIDLWDAEENVKIIVAPGVYHEALFLAKHKVPNHLLFVSSSEAPVILDGTGVSNVEKSLVYSHALFNFTDTENVTFRNFIFTRSELDSAIEFKSSKLINFENCRFTSNANKAIRVDDSKQLTFTACDISQNALGLSLNNSKNIVLESTSLTNNKTDSVLDAKSDLKKK